MSRRKKDFLELSSFLFVILSILLTLGQVIVNLGYRVFDTEFISFWSNLKIFLSFELFFLILSSAFGMIYIFWFFKYTIDEYGRERKVKRH